MNVLVVGYGSMGKRRIRLVRKLLKDPVFYCVDSNSDRLSQIKEDGHIPCRSIDDALAYRPQVAFVCTSPGTHDQIILKLLCNGVHVFSELNLSTNGYDEIIAKSEQNDARLFMSSTLLYDRQIQAIKQEVSTANQPLTYIYHIGQYLPDWHPWESYKDFFASKKETNGCREIFAIQLPWLIDVFGEVDSVHIVSRKNTQLDIDFADTYIVTLEHVNQTAGVFVVDVLARDATTYLEIMGETVHIKWGGKPESLMKYDFHAKKMLAMESYSNYEHVEGYDSHVIEDKYADEIRAFFDFVENNVKPKYTLEDDAYVLRLIDEIEGAK